MTCQVTVLECLLGRLGGWEHEESLPGEGNLKRLLPR